MNVTRRLADAFLTVLADTLADLAGLWDEVRTDPETGRPSSETGRHSRHTTFPTPYRYRRPERDRTVLVQQSVSNPATPP